MTPLEALAAFAMGGLARTWRYEIVGEKNVTAVRRRGLPVLFAVWHGQLLAPLWHRRRESITLLVSAHRDGARLAQAARRWGYLVVSGSTNRGGVGGLRRFVRALRSGRDGAIAPDGPRGPAGVAKDGIVAAARHGGAAVIPVATSASSYWQARSWDRFCVPRPFARVRVVYGPPITVERYGALTPTTSQIESALGTVQRVAQC
jgi:lysophospholipid acyltransferase (LPLAT)-like uncharacterized protein